MRLTTLGTLAVLSIATVGLSTAARAQVSARPVTLGIAGGVAIPMGDLADGSNAGYNISGQLAFHAPLLIPLGVRLEVSYSDFTVQKSQLSGSGIDGASTRSLGLIGNLTYTLPTTVIRPYVIAGAGWYNDKVAAVAAGVTASIDENDFGVNGGAGVQVPLGRLTPFVEARYHSVHVGRTLGRGTLSYVPITFGVTF